MIRTEFQHKTNEKLSGHGEWMEETESNVLFIISTNKELNKRNPEICHSLGYSGAEEE